MKYESLDTLLRLALIQEYHTDKAKVKKMTLKLLKRITPHVQQMILNDVLASPDPRGTTTYHAQRYISLNTCAAEISNMGFIGMVVHEGTAYPLRIIIEDEYDKQYVLNNEHTVAYMTANNFTSEMQPRKGSCDVVFFKNRGFSGRHYKVAVGV